MKTLPLSDSSRLPTPITTRSMRLCHAMTAASLAVPVVLLVGSWAAHKYEPDPYSPANRPHVTSSAAGEKVALTPASAPVEDKTHPITPGDCKMPPLAKRCGVSSSRRLLILQGGGSECPGRLIGTKAPPFLQYDANPASPTHGELLGPQHFLGKVVVLNFFMYDCAPCKAEMPAFQKLAALGLPDVAVLALQTEGISVEVSWLAKEKGLTFPILGSRGKATTKTRVCWLMDKRTETQDLNNGQEDDYLGSYTGSMYGVTSIPVTMIIDKNGIIREGWYGRVEFEVLQQKVRKYL